MKKVLFVCIENSCRSQMAEGLSKLYGKEIFLSYSGGSRPSGKINPMAIEVMKEIGVDISSQRSKGFNDLGTDDFDVVITMGCSDTCPFMPSRKHIDWSIKDPKGKGIEFFRAVRDDISARVKKLSEDIRDNKI